MALKHITMLYAQIEDWHWWDNGNASKIHKWLDKNTELGADESCMCNRIYFLHEKELLWFKLRWHV